MWRKILIISMAACAAACGGGKGPVDGGSSGGSSGGASGGATALASAILTETNGAAAAQAYKDHVPSAAEAARTAAFLAYSANAVATGTFPQGLVASDLTAEMTQLALQYPDFFSAGPDGGLALVKHGTGRPRHYTCGQSCDPSASAFATDFLQALPANLPAGLEADAGAIAAAVGSAAAALEQSGTAVGQAFDQAIDTDNPTSVQAFIDDFLAVELTSADLQAAAATLGLTTAQTQALEDAAAVIIAGGVLSAANAAIEAAAASYAGCLEFQATSCASTTGGTGSGSSNRSSTSGQGTTGGSTSGSSSVGSTGASGSTTGGVGSTSSSGSGSGASTAGTLLSTGTVYDGTPDTSLALQMLSHDSHGNLMAQWMQGSGTDAGCAAYIAVSFYDAASDTWSPTTVPPTPPFVESAGLQENCQDYASGYIIFTGALSDNGDAVIAWPTQQSFDGGGVAEQIYADQYSHTSGTWLGPTLIGPSDLFYNLVTNNGDGAPYAVVNSVGDGWILFSAEPYACETSRAMAVPFSSAGGFGQAVVIDPDPTASAASLNPPACQCGGEQVQVGQGIVATALSDDTFVAAWGEEDTSTNASCIGATYVCELVGVRGTAAGWGTPFTVQTGSLYQPPSIYGIASGGTNVALAWEVGLDAGPSLQGPVGVAVSGLQPADSNWEAAQLLPNLSTANISSEDLALNASGAGFVTFENTVGSEVSQLVAPISSSLVVGSAQDLTMGCTLQTSKSFATAVYGMVAVDDDGSAAVVWMLDAQSPSVSLGATYAPASGWSGCSAVGETTATGGPAYPYVADLGNGTFGTLYELYMGLRNGQMYFAAGQP